MGRHRASRGVRPRPGIGGIVAGGVSVATVGHQLDEAYATAATGSFDRPLLRSVDGEKVVAVDTEAGEAVGVASGGECWPAVVRLR